MLRGVAATGAATTAVAALGGQAAANNHHFDIGDITIADGLVNVVVRNINVEDVEGITVRIRSVEEPRIITLEDTTIDVDVDISHVNVQALNNINGIVQALAEDSVIQMARQCVSV